MVAVVIADGGGARNASRRPMQSISGRFVMKATQARTQAMEETVRNKNHWLLAAVLAALLVVAT